jgi:hypothetical protein
MKTFDLKSLLAGALLTLTVVVVMLVVTAKSVPATWEYKAVFVEGGGSEWVYGKKINAAAKEGWYVVGAAKENDRELLLVMRRPKDVQEPWSTRWKFWKK